MSNRTTLVWQENLAKDLDVTPRTIRNWRAKGILPEPDVRIGRRPGWYPETITKAIAQHAETDGGPDCAKPAA